MVSNSVKYENDVFAARFQSRFQYLQEKEKPKKKVTGIWDFDDDDVSDENILANKIVPKTNKTGKPHSHMLPKHISANNQYDVPEDNIMNNKIVLTTKKIDKPQSPMPPKKIITTNEKNNNKKTTMDVACSEKELCIYYRTDQAELNRSKLPSSSVAENSDELCKKESNSTKKLDTELVRQQSIELDNTNKMTLEKDLKEPENMKTKKRVRTISHEKEFQNEFGTLKRADVSHENFLEKLYSSADEKSLCRILTLEKCIVKKDSTQCFSKSSHQYGSTLVNVQVFKDENSKPIKTIKVEGSKLSLLLARYPHLKEIIPELSQEKLYLPYSTNAMNALLELLLFGSNAIDTLDIALEVCILSVVYCVNELEKACQNYCSKNNCFVETFESAMAYWKRNGAFPIKSSDVADPSLKNLCVLNFRNTEYCSVKKGNCFIRCIPQMQMSLLFPLNFHDVIVFEDSFAQDLKNEVHFKAVSGQYYISGLQLKFFLPETESKELSIYYDISKDDETLCEKEYSEVYKPTVAITFSNPLLIKTNQELKISIIISDVILKDCPLLNIENRIVENKDLKIKLVSNSIRENNHISVVEKVFYFADLT